VDVIKGNSNDSKKKKKKRKGNSNDQKEHGAVGMGHLKSREYHCHIRKIPRLGPIKYCKGC
jgi:hypothetical protein